MSTSLVQRNAQGQVIALSREALTPEQAAAGGWETAATEAPDVQAFVRKLSSEVSANPLAETDAALARVTEDLIEVLIDRGVIQFTDLPVPAQNKLMERRQTRSRLANRLNLLGDSDII